MQIVWRTCEIAKLNLDSNTPRDETLNVREAVRYSDGQFYEDISRRISHLNTLITVTQTHTDSSSPSLWVERPPPVSVPEESQFHPWASPSAEKPPPPDHAH